MSALPGQLPLFRDETALGRLCADAAVAQVAQPTDSADWIAHALVLIEHLSSSLDTFTADDVWLLSETCGLGSPREPRALGAVMRRARAQGLCHPTEHYVLSKRAACHSRPVRVWRGGTA